MFQSESVPQGRARRQVRHRVRPPALHGQHAHQPLRGIPPPAPGGRPAGRKPPHWHPAGRLPRPPVRQLQPGRGGGAHVPRHGERGLGRRPVRLRLQPAGAREREREREKEREERVPWAGRRPFLSIVVCLASRSCSLRGLSLLLLGGFDFGSASSPCGSPTRPAGRHQIVFPFPPLLLLLERSSDSPSVEWGPSGTRRRSL